MKIIKVLIFCLSISSLNAQITEDVKELLKPFENVKSQDEMYYEKVIDCVRKLSKKASSNELLYISTNSKNPYIKTLAIDALKKNNDTLIFKAFEKSINSKDTIKSSGHRSSSLSLSKYIFEKIVFNGKNFQTHREKNSTILTEIIFNQKNINIDLLESISQFIYPSEKYYKSIRKIVIENKSSSLLIPLAKYQKNQDIKLIKSFGKQAISAIQYFPHNDFLEILNDNIAEYNDYKFMFSLGSYCNNQSKEIIKKVIELKLKELSKENEDNNFLLETIYHQIEKSNCNLYNHLLEDLWTNNKIISDKVLTNFEKNHNKNEIKDFLYKGLMLKGTAVIFKGSIYDIPSSIEDIKNKMNNITFGTTGRLVELLNKLKRLSKERYEDAVKFNIIQIDGFEFQNLVFALKDYKLIKKNSKTIISKMRSLEKAYSILEIMEVLKEINDMKTFKNGIEIIKERRTEFKNSEVWEENLQEFIKKYKLKIQ